MYQYTVSLQGKAENGIPCLTSIQEALQRSCLEHPDSSEKITIALLPGEYREKLVVIRPNTRLIGLGKNPEDTTIAFNDGAYKILSDGNPRGTFRTATLRISASDFTAENLTIKNDCGPGIIHGQGIAVYADGDKILFDHCILDGWQDTLFTAPLPEKEFSAGGFRGPGEFLPRINGRQLYRNCLIKGEVDFIFGSATAYFENCEFFSKECGRDGIQSYVFAGSAPEGQDYNYVAEGCRFTSDCPDGSCFLGRPWREYAKTVLLRCEIGPHIVKQGWDDWASQGGHDHLYYAEYACTGPGADRSARPDWCKKLTDSEAMKYSIEQVLQGWNP